LIADFSGQSLIRLGHSGGGAALRYRERRLPSACPWPGRHTGGRWRLRPSR
jgi:hypothetical protein